MKTLNDVRTFLSSIPFIHQGGCGIAALAMYRWLLTYCDERCDIIYTYSWSEKSLYDNNEIFKKKPENCEASSCSHALIFYRGKYYDSFKITDEPEYPIHHILSEREVIKSLNNLLWWNDNFNRKYISRIAKTLKIDLSDIKKIW